MSVYLLVDITVLDAAQYGEYIRRVPAIVAKHGGRYLVRGGKIVPISGDWQPDRVIVVEFPSFSHIEQWFNSPEYQEIAPLRLGSTRGRVIAVEGLEPGAGEQP